jgi:hypothetical protein
MMIRLPIGSTFSDAPLLTEEGPGLVVAICTGRKIIGILRRAEICKSIHEFQDRAYDENEYYYRVVFSDAHIY